MGAIQAAVLDVLGEAHAPIGPREVHAAVEQRLGQPVSKDTIGSYLSVAARTAAGRGLATRGRKPWALTSQRHSPANSNRVMRRLSRTRMLIRGKSNDLLSFHSRRSKRRSRTRCPDAAGTSVQHVGAPASASSGAVGLGGSQAWSPLSGGGQQRPAERIPRILPSAG